MEDIKKYSPNQRQNTTQSLIFALELEIQLKKQDF